MSTSPRSTVGISYQWSRHTVLTSRSAPTSLVDGFLLKTPQKHSRNMRNNFVRVCWVVHCNYSKKALVCMIQRGQTHLRIDASWYC